MILEGMRGLKEGMRWHQKAQRRWQKGAASEGREG